MRIDVKNGLPEVTLVRVEPIVREFRQRRVSGQVTIILNFMEGQDQPSELRVRECGVGERKKKDDGSNRP
jgi:hypothetical protein